MTLIGVYIAKRFVICMVEIYQAGQKNYTTARQDKFQRCHHQTWWSWHCCCCWRLMMISVMSFRRWKIWEGGMAISCRRRLRHFRLCRARSSILGLLTHNTGPKYSLRFFQILCILNTINTGPSNLQYWGLILQTLFLSPNTLYLKHNQYWAF